MLVNRIHAAAVGAYNGKKMKVIYWYYKGIEWERERRESKSKKKCSTKIHTRHWLSRMSKHDLLVNRCWRVMIMTMMHWHRRTTIVTIEMWYDSDTWRGTMTHTHTHTVDKPALNTSYIGLSGEISTLTSIHRIIIIVILVHVWLRQM